MKGMLRPAATVMPASALVPEVAVVTPPPNRFTHAVRVRQPFYGGTAARGEPSGMFAPGAKVVLMVQGRGDACRVVDRRGRYVTTSRQGLEPLS
jgi:hypothetical protein